ncbi:MotA/TolQ/ExbB proton channel family protein [Persicirhabdus sediminis]|uniref:MotA/TolQ/ExbB proton channel family protein n=1 Tax=Persicirhabdus sediminis TaxID=454144 RepID=A0A8J7SI19_9BACT|nr:MotA/TolQ/ExbB proton channel family protein [Persicirhabdus sediminis]MBK1790151.1 MotA/TolQ/ExbB proton channel family protein [Persicirhabdus sediminis]
MKKLITLWVCSAMAATSLFAENDSIKQDLKLAIEKLSEQRAEIAQEKPQLAKAFENTKADLLERRRQVRLARMTEADRESLLKELKRRKHTEGQDIQYLSGLTRDFGIKFENALLAGEKEAYKSTFDQLLGAKSLSTKDQLTQGVKVLELGVDRLDQLMGGAVVAGKASAVSGEVKTGNYYLAGPLAWFVADDSSLAGSVVYEKGSAIPMVSQGNAGDVKYLAAGGEAKVMVDVTGGKAQALAELSFDRWSLFKKGGFWIWPIISIALISLICALIKATQIYRVSTPSDGWLAQILEAVREGELENAKEICDRAYHPVGGLIKKSIDFIKAGPDVVEEVVYEQLIGVQSKLQTWLSFIAITAATAPLIGLLGTVSGMIKTFNVITVVGTSDPRPLAGGISEALVTTLFGLIVAIPALILHALLSRRCQGISQAAEKLGLTFVNGLRGGSEEKAN